MAKTLEIVADVGGTYVRFGISRNGGLPTDSTKYEVKDFTSFESALMRYCTEKSLDLNYKHRVLIASAGQMLPDGDVWHITNNKSWDINIGKLRGDGCNIPSILNDFEAAAWGVMSLEKKAPKSIHLIKEGFSKENETKAIIGSGTGLGLAYLIKSNGLFDVKPSHGGFNCVPTETKEQFDIKQSVLQMTKGDESINFEDLLSGRGLHNLYKAVCKNNMINDVKDLRDLFKDIENTEIKLDPQAQGALRLFHEFLGIYANSSIISGNSFGGIYLTGGVIERIINADRFDLPSFEKFFLVASASIVKDDLKRTKIAYIKDPSLPLKGLVYKQQITAQAQMQGPTTPHGSI